MERKLRYCAVCGTGYKFCPKCNEDKNKPLFHYTFCSENCKDVYSVISSYRDGELNKDDAVESLSRLDLSKIDNFGESYKIYINEILSHDCVKNLCEDVVNNQEDYLEIENNEKVLKKSKRAKKDVE